ncbi:MAG: hypothetical protein ABIK19_05890, partial [candidate division WOR-3 bacterium]
MERFKYLSILVSICFAFLIIPTVYAQTVLRDLDINDNIGNLVGNILTMNLAVNGTGYGQFWVVNPNSSNNPDPDPYGTIGGTASVLFEATHLYHITNNAVQIDSTQITFPAMPVSVPYGQGVPIGVSVSIPDTQAQGTYEGWVIAYRQFFPDVRDSFLFRVIVDYQEDVDIREITISGTVSPDNNLVQFGTFTILNPNSWSDNPDPDDPGNCDLFNLRFTAQDFIHATDPTKHIDISHIYLSAPTIFGPTPVTEAVINQLISGEEIEVIVWLDIPYGTYAGDYDGQIMVYDDDGWPSDAVGLNLTVESMYDLDISDNTGNLVGNWLTLNNLPGTQVNGHFVLINPNNPDLNVDPDIYGNTDLTSIYYHIDTLNHTTNVLQFIPNDVISLSITPPYTLLSGGSDMIVLTVDIPPDQFEGEYTGWVRVIDENSGVGDSFQLRVIVGPQEDIDFVQEEIAGSADVGDTLVLLGEFWVVNQDPTQWPWPDPDGPSNVDLYNLRFAVTHLRDSANPTRTIPPSQIYLALTSSGVATGPMPVDQANINELLLGDTAYGKVWVYLPYGTRAGTYTGTLQVYDDDGWPTDFLGLKLWVNPYYDLDIADNAQSLFGNKMTLAAVMGDSTQVGYFRVINPNTAELNVDPDIYGNADFDSIKVHVINFN